MTAVSGGTDPEDLVRLVQLAYDTADADGAARLFEPDAVLVVRPGEAVTGPALGAAIHGFLAQGLRIRITIRHIYRAGDVALLLTDHVTEGSGADGRPVRQSGTATDVARRGPDGRWRYLVDNPSGVDR